MVQAKRAPGKQKLQKCILGLSRDGKNGATKTNAKEFSLHFDSVLRIRCCAALSGDAVVMVSDKHWLLLQAGRPHAQPELQGHRAMQHDMHAPSHTVSEGSIHLTSSKFPSTGFNVGSCVRESTKLEPSPKPKLSWGRPPPSPQMSSLAARGYYYKRHFFFSTDRPFIFSKSDRRAARLELRR